MKTTILLLAAMLATLILWRIEWDTTGRPPRLIPDMTCRPAKSSVPPEASVPFQLTPIPSPNGNALFSIHCAPCHGEQGNGKSFTARQTGMPAVGDLVNTSKTPEELKQALIQGQGAMPAFAPRLTPAQVEELHRYILQLHQP